MGGSGRSVQERHAAEGERWGSGALLGTRRAMRAPSSRDPRKARQEACYADAGGLFTVAQARTGEEVSNTPVAG